LQRLKGSSKYDLVRVAIKLCYVQASLSCYPPLDNYGPVPRPIRTRTVEIKEHQGKEFILCDCCRYDKSKMACEHAIHVLLSLGVDLTSYHLAGIRWTTNYNIKNGSAEISDALRDAFERCLQHPGIPLHPFTWVDDWLGLPTFSSSCLTMNHFCPRSLARPPARPFSTTTLSGQLSIFTIGSQPPWVPMCLNWWSPPHHSFHQWLESLIRCKCPPPSLQ
jgi:hypothetical protein